MFKAHFHRSKKREFPELPKVLKKAAEKKSPGGNDSPLSYFEIIKYLYYSPAVFKNKRGPKC
jgi:hypothetical protein